MGRTHAKDAKKKIGHGGKDKKSMKEENK